MAGPRDAETGLQVPTVGADRNSWGVFLNQNWDVVGEVFKGDRKIKPDLKVGEWQIEGENVTSTAEEINQLDGVKTDSSVQDQLDAIKTTADDGTDLDEAVTKAGLTSVADDIIVKGASGWEIRNKATEAEVTAKNPVDVVKSFTPRLLDAAIAAKATFDPSKPFCFQLRKDQGEDNDTQITRVVGGRKWMEKDDWGLHEFNWVTDASDTYSFFQPGSDTRSINYNNGKVHLNTGASTRGTIHLGSGKYYIEVMAPFWPGDGDFTIRARLLDKTNDRAMAHSMSMYIYGGRKSDVSTYIIPTSAYITVPDREEINVAFQTYVHFESSDAAKECYWGRATNTPTVPEIYTSATIWQLGI